MLLVLQISYPLESSILRIWPVMTRAAAMRGVCLIDNTATYPCCWENRLLPFTKFDSSRNWYWVARLATNSTKGQYLRLLSNEKNMRRVEPTRNDSKFYGKSRFREQWEETTRVYISMSINRDSCEQGQNRTGCKTYWGQIRWEFCQRTRSKSRENFYKRKPWYLGGFKNAGSAFW